MESYGSVERVRLPARGMSARAMRTMIISSVATLAVLCAVFTIRAHSARVALVEEADGLELAAYLSPDEAAEFKKVDHPALLPARCFYLSHM